MDTMATAAHKNTEKPDHVKFMLEKMNDLKWRTHTLTAYTKETMNIVGLKINAFLDGHVSRETTFCDITQEFKNLFFEAIKLIEQHDKIIGELLNTVNSVQSDLNDTLDAIITIASNLYVVVEEIEQQCATTIHIIADETLDSRALKDKCQELHHFRSILMY